ncbi:hypothetical protein HYH03_011544 [Edaphochlamys debaryana]|uniref:phosphatidylinositol N-acetylglucosaminyltransferase n=1 Tax=Edaphochlamys debaryana TaxID=47281 RepID=A0A835XUM2_9CHLO|nr:hypothetical protein HYH03_011544 [Edaphochlamys debaryana]|eukprot:KAG2490079.1 hypothetical protein HYH03_011544 [Edaphochlamys debaryana]
MKNGGELAGDARRRHRVVMVSDFFYPNFGGVENHIYQLSQCLIDQGHKVVVVTHAYGDCRGVRYLTNGLKVYYLPRRPFLQQACFPSLLGWARLLRSVCLREGASLVHGHQAFSTLALEAVLVAAGMGLRVVFTDHSLFGFADPASILLNKLLKAVLSDAHAVICVSHTSRENTVLRACLQPGGVAVIPNAVDASQFFPAPLPAPAAGSGADCGGGGGGGGGGGRSAASDTLPPGLTPWPRDPLSDPVVVVVLSRLVARKARAGGVDPPALGVDLLALVLPALLAAHPNVRLLVGGDGPKRQLLERVFADQGLEGRVEMAGAVPHERARDFMVRGHVFVNASLTEAFCMALVEAAAAGLVVVSTAVGGVPEVLPPDMLLLSQPSAEGLLAALEAALLRLPSQDPHAQHARVAAMYNWNDVARRTAHVYDSAVASARDDSLPARMWRYLAAGRWVGCLFALVAALAAALLRAADWAAPAAEVDAAPDWPRGEGSRGGGRPHGESGAGGKRLGGTREGACEAGLSPARPRLRWENRAQ